MAGYLSDMFGEGRYAEDICGQAVGDSQFDLVSGGNPFPELSLCTGFSASRLTRRLVHLFSGLSATVGMLLPATKDGLSDFIL